jgi:hypothetical protein
VHRIGQPTSRQVVFDDCLPLVRAGMGNGPHAQRRRCRKSHPGSDGDWNTTPRSGPAVDFAVGDDNPPAVIELRPAIIVDGALAAAGMPDQRHVFTCAISRLKSSTITAGPAGVG